MWDALDDELEEARGRDRGADAGEHCLAKNRYVHNSDVDARHQLAVQVRYIAVHDPRDPPDREARQLFTEDAAHVTGKEARGMIWSNRSTRGAVCFHRLILSPSTGLGIKTAAEAQEWTRVVMAEMGRQVDRKLTWVAGTHTNRDHTHVHVLIAGEAPQPSAGGARRVVRLGRHDLKALRERIAIDAARPIREAGRARELRRARERQEARMTALDRRLGVLDLPTPTQTPAPIDTPAQAIPLTPASQAAPKRHWWQRGN